MPFVELEVTKRGGKKTIKWNPSLHSESRTERRKFERRGQYDKRSNNRKGKERRAKVIQRETAYHNRLQKLGLV